MCDKNLFEYTKYKKNNNGNGYNYAKTVFPKLMQEFRESMGNCKSDAPKLDNSVFLTKQSMLNDEAFPNVNNNGNGYNYAKTVFQKLMQEFRESMGNCKSDAPKLDNSVFLTKQSMLNDEAFPNVLEVSKIPVGFTYQDFRMVFSQYKANDFSIEWVDDTHALAVLSSSKIAAEILTMGHAFIVFKPLSHAIVETRLKAKQRLAPEQLNSTRPVTYPDIARRLIARSLGVRQKTSAEERKNENHCLFEAKNRNMLANKSRKSRTAENQM